MIESYIIRLCNKNKYFILQDYKRSVYDKFGVHISTSLIYNIFKKNKYTLRTASQINIRKFISTNINYYNYYYNIFRHKLNYKKCVFLDESRFNNSITNKKIRYLRGYQVVNVNNFNYMESINLILMINYKGAFYELDEDNFNQISFLKFIVKSIKNGFLKRGMILILDNCSIHKGKKIKTILIHILQSHGIRLLFLPKYSPELNAAEYCFKLLKNFIKSRRSFGNLYSLIFFSNRKLLKKKNLKKFIKQVLYRSIKTKYFK
jgi:transposase